MAADVPAEEAEMEEDGTPGMSLWGVISSCQGVISAELLAQHLLAKIQELNRCR